MWTFTVLRQREVWLLSVVAALGAGCGSASLPVEPVHPTQTDQTADSRHGIPIHRHDFRRSVDANEEPNDAGRPAEPAWVLDVEGNRVVVVTGAQELRWESTSETGAVEVLSKDPGIDSVHWRITLPSGTLWLRARRVDGVLAGRVAHGTDEPAPGPRWSGHVTGWNTGVFEGTRARVFRLQTATGELVTLRLDGDVNEGTAVGQWKRVGSTSRAWLAEAPQYDLSIARWDDGQLEFSTIGEPEPRTCHATLTSVAIHGSCLRGGAFIPFHGERIQLFSAGLLPKSPDELARWARTTREGLQVLMMGPDPRPTQMEVTSGPLMSPFPTLACWPSRDDAEDAFPSNYLRQELELAVTYRVGSENETAVRREHGWLLIPQEPAPPGGFPTVIAVNGHGMGSVAVIDPNDVMGWYGDAYARRGYVVFALDVSHRPIEDRWQLYTDVPNGDDPARGNAAHPAIRGRELDSDWEEDGERVADVMRAREYLSTLPSVDSARVSVTGISMGGEVTTWAAALDPGLWAANPIGYSPDTEVLRISGNHACYRWQHGDVDDYVSASDLHALIAPRPLLIETGIADRVFSRVATPFSGDLQVVNRSRTAWGSQAARLVHYLHPDEHRFRAGDSACGGAALGVTEPVARGPSALDPVSWQLDITTQVVAHDVFSWLASQRAETARSP